MPWCFSGVVVWLSEYFCGSASLSDITCLPNINLQFCMSLLWQPDQYLKLYRTCCLPTRFKSHQRHHWGGRKNQKCRSGAGGGRLFKVPSNPHTSVVDGPPRALPRWAERCVTLLSIHLPAVEFLLPYHMRINRALSNRNKKLFLVLLFHPTEETVK